jgi:hypothetical protein
VTPFHALVLADGGENTLANLALLDLDTFFLALGSLAAGRFGLRNFWIY